jgi:peptidoglycan/LPS O-acetylase OafA/YrhL
MTEQGTRTQGTGRVPGLDVLRGVAIALVLLRHAWSSRIGGAGVVGVTIFFALSGYLITGLLISEHERTHAVSYRRFYRNRVLRLYPSLLVMLVALMVVEAVTNRLDDRHVLPATFIIGATYLSDLPLGVSVSRGITHLWTLATEEQFYLIWPAVLLAATRLRRVGLTIALVCVAFTVFCAGTAVVHRHAITGIYTYPSSWAVTLAIGGAAYVYRERLRQSWIVRAPMIALAVCVLGALSVPHLKLHVVTYLVLGPLIAFCTVLLIFAVQRWATLPAVLEPLRWLGLISYSVYLWNFPTVQLLENPRTKHLSVLGSFLSIVIPIGVAVLSWYAIERPVASWRRRRDARLDFARPETAMGPAQHPRSSEKGTPSLTGSALLAEAVEQAAKK